MKILVVISLLVSGLAAGGQVPKAVGSSQQREEHPFFETRVIVARDAGRFRRNAYPTVVTLPDGRLFLVWSGSTSTSNKKADDKMRIVGSFSDDGGRTWTTPEEVINIEGFGDHDPNIILTKDEIQVYSTSTPVEPKPMIISQTWKATRKLNGSTWSKPELVPLGKKYIVGKIHAGVSLADGTLLMPYSWDIHAEEGIPYTSEGGMRLKSGVLISKDQGKTWSPSQDIFVEPPRTSTFGTGGVVEPSIAVLENGEIFILLRTADQWHYETRSRDNGKTWSTPVPSPLQGHNTPAALWRLRGRPDVMVVWDNAPKNRWPLEVALSTDNCKTWSKPKTLSNQGVQASYPTSTELPDGTLIVIWQQDPADSKGRNLHIARFNRAWLLQ